MARLPEWGWGAEWETLLRSWLHAALYPLRLETGGEHLRRPAGLGRAGWVLRLETLNQALSPRGLRSPPCQELRSGKPQPLHLCEGWPFPWPGC